jgi:predicted transcriptional regulator
MRLCFLGSRAEATVLEVQNRLRPVRDLAPQYPPSRPLLSRLEKRGVVAHRLDGRQFVYRRS